MVPLLGKKEKRLRKLHHYVCSRPYGGREIGEPSIIVKVLDKTILKFYLESFLRLG